MIASLFLLLTVGSYIFAQTQLKIGANLVMQELSNGISTGRMNEPPHRDSPSIRKFPPKGPHPLQFPEPARLDFSVIVSQSGQLKQISSTTIIDRKEALKLTQQVVKAPRDKGEVYHLQKKYMFLRTKLNSKQGTLVVFHDFSQEDQILRSVLLALSGTGLICLVFSFFGSLFMANRAIIPIQKAWEQQKEFLADASHELRTPIAVIQTNLEVVLEDPIKTVDSQSKWLLNIKEENSWMAHFVDSLLFLARSDSQQQPLDKNHFPLEKAICNAAESFKPLALSHGIIIKIDVETPIVFYGDESRIKQLLGILVDNAIKYSPSGGAIDIRLTKSSKTVNLSVSDQGEGISPENIDKIFDRFFQSDHSRSKKGAGLGLSIAKWIVDSHQGSIEVSSIVGSGTTFHISFFVN